jgi:hypothetical protein
LKNDTQKANANYIQFVRALEQDLVVAQLQFNQPNR